MCSLASGLVRGGCDVEVAALLPETGAHPFAERVIEAGLTLHEIRTGHRSYLGQARAVAELVRDGGFDLLHTHIAHADVIGYMATRRLDVPWVTTVHGLTGEGLKNAAYLRLNLIVVKRCDAVVCVAENVREQVEASGVEKRRIHLIQNGYLPVPTSSRAEARATLGLDQDKPSIGWIGRLSFEKGADMLLEALACMGDDGATGVVVGDGPERDRLAAQAAALGLGDDRLRFVGRVDNAARLLPAFDVLALSSRTEGTPMVLLEAMAAQVPIVAFAVGGVPGVLTSESAFLADPEDVPGFVAELRSALGPGDEATRRANAAYEVFLSRYSVERCSKPVARLYDEVMRARARSR